MNYPINGQMAWKKTATYPSTLSSQLPSLSSNSARRTLFPHFNAPSIHRGSVSYAEVPAGGPDIFSL